MTKSEQLLLAALLLGGIMIAVGGSSGAATTILSPSVMPAFSGDIKTAAGSTVARLTYVNNNTPGTYITDAQHGLKLTVGKDGRITSIALVPIANPAAASLQGGPSGAIAVNGGIVDIVTAVVPRLSAANDFAGINTFENGIQLTPKAGEQPDCIPALRGTFWFQNNGIARDSVQVCGWDGAQLRWLTVAAS